MAGPQLAEYRFPRLGTGFRGWWTSVVNWPVIKNMGVFFGVTGNTKRLNISCGVRSSGGKRNDVVNRKNNFISTLSTTETSLSIKNLNGKPLFRSQGTNDGAFKRPSLYRHQANAYRIVPFPQIFLFRVPLCPSTRFIPPNFWIFLVVSSLIFSFSLFVMCLFVISPLIGTIFFYVSLSYFIFLLSHDIWLSQHSLLAIIANTILTSSLEAIFFCLANVKLRFWQHALAPIASFHLLGRHVKRPELGVPRMIAPDGRGLLPSPTTLA